MAYTVGNGDTIQTNYVVETLQAKVFAQPGKTSNASLFDNNGETVKYWVLGTSGVSKGTAGAKHTYGAKGGHAKTVVFSDAVNIDVVLPGVNVATVNAPLVQKYLVREAMKASNIINEDFAAAAGTAAVADAAVTYSALDVYKSLLDLRASYITLNKSENMKPDALLVNPSVMAALMKQDLIVYKDNGVAEFAGMTVVEVADQTIPAVMYNSVAMYCATNFKNISVVDATPAGYPGGTIIGGEIVYAVGATEFPSDFAGTAVLKFK